MFSRINEKLGKMKSVIKNETGATMVEYALMVALIAVVAVAAVGTLGSTVNSKFESINTSFTPAS